MTLDNNSKEDSIWAPASAAGRGYDGAQIRVDLRAYPRVGGLQRARSLSECLHSHECPAVGGGLVRVAQRTSGRRILAANKSRRLTTPQTVRPSTTGRWRNPFSSMIWAASSTDVPGSAD